MTKSTTGLVILVALAAPACAKDSTGDAGIDGPVRLLNSANPTGDDDDPAIAVDAQGQVHVAFLSDRDGTKDLYETNSTAIDLATGTVTWSPLVQITNNAPAAFPPPAQGDNYPSLFIDAAGTHHVAWYRQDLSNAAHILYAHSDGTANGWAVATVVNATTGLHYDRFAHLVQFGPTDLRIYFNSSTRSPPGQNAIMVVQSADTGKTWSTPAAVASLNTANEQSAFPWIVKLSSNWFIGTFVRWKLEPSADFLDTSSDVFYAQSADGNTWGVEQVTADPADVKNDLVPRLFRDHTGVAHLTWSTIAFGDPAADIVQTLVSDRASYPSKVTTLAPALGVADHSAEIVPLTVDGQPIYLMIWVRILTPPHNQIVYRLSSSP